jgi:DNA-dependent RNA polymerase auxiliary subunit epsilon
VLHPKRQNNEEQTGRLSLSIFWARANDKPNREKTESDLYMNNAPNTKAQNTQSVNDSVFREREFKTSGGVTCILHPR